MDRKFLKKISKMFDNIDESLLKEATEEIPTPSSTFRGYPVGTASQAYMSYINATLNNDTDSANKIAGILEDIYDITPPILKKEVPHTKTKYASDDMYDKFLPREKRYMKKLASLDKEAYDVSGSKARELLHLREVFCRDFIKNANEKAIKAYGKVANVVAEYDNAKKKMTKSELAKLADAIESIDTKLGISQYYDVHIPNPVDVVTGFITDSNPLTYKLANGVLDENIATKLARDMFIGVIDEKDIDKIFDGDKFSLNKFASFMATADKKVVRRVEKLLSYIF